MTQLLVCERSRGLVDDYLYLSKVLGSREIYLDPTQCLEIDVSCRDSIFKKFYLLLNFTKKEHGTSATLFQHCFN